MTTTPEGDDDGDLWTAEPIDSASPDHEELILAVGRLAIASGQAEVYLRGAIYLTGVFGDNVDLLTEGESVNWLISKVRLLAEAKFGEAQGKALVAGPLKRAQVLFEQRNRFIHCEFRITDAGRYVTAVSRRNREWRMLPCSVQEIDEVADKLLVAAADLQAILFTARMSERERSGGDDESYMP